MIVRLHHICTLWWSYNFSESFSDRIPRIDTKWPNLTQFIQEYADPDVILDPKKIRRKYILSWFFVDMISTIPLDYILQLIYGNVDPKGIYLTLVDPSWPIINWP